MRALLSLPLQSITATRMGLFNLLNRAIESQNGGEKTVATGPAVQSVVQPPRPAQKDTQKETAVSSEREVSDSPRQASIPPKQL